MVPDALYIVRGTVSLTPTFWWGLLKPISSFFDFTNFYQIQPNAVHLLCITFIIGRCRCSSAAATPVKYEGVSANPIIPFQKRISECRKMTMRLVTPTPDLKSSGRQRGFGSRACMAPAMMDTLRSVCTWVAARLTRECARAITTTDHNTPPCRTPLAPDPLYHHTPWTSQSTNHQSWTRILLNESKGWSA